MNPGPELAELFQTWRQLSEAEARAIQLDAWPQLEQLQAAKLALQPRIDAATAQVRTKLARQTAEAREHERLFRNMAEELMRLEERNLDLIASRRQAVLAQRELLDQAANNLRHVHRSYAPRPTAHWQSYS